MKDFVLKGLTGLMLNFIKMTMNSESELKPHKRIEINIFFNQAKQDKHIVLP